MVLGYFFISTPEAVWTISNLISAILSYSISRYDLHGSNDLIARESGSIIIDFAIN